MMENFEDFRAAAVRLLEQDTMYRVKGDEEDLHTVGQCIAAIARYVELIAAATSPRQVINYLMEVEKFVQEDAPGALD